MNIRLEPEFAIYLAGWMLACVIAAVLAYCHRRETALFHKPYWRGITQPWKLTTFLIAASGMTVIAPITGDPTWDYIDASFMSIFTFMSAPWVVGVLYLSAQRRIAWRQTYIAVCVWLFSASWSYDLYLVLRDGEYPFTWLPNIFASSVLYLCGGLMWSLEWKPERGVHFGFTEAGWPSGERTARVMPIFWFALPFMILVAAMIIPFTLPFIRSQLN